MNEHRRKVLLNAAALSLVTLASPSFAAEDYPNRPITLVVPFAPGGNIDIVGRTLAEPLGKILGQPVVVDNRAGGSGSIGAGSVARASADGYTLVIGTAGQLVTVPQLIKTPYTSSNFKPLGMVSETSIAAITRKSDTRFKSMKELVDFAKANPGRLNGGHAGTGTPNHLGLLQLENALGINISMIPYKGMGPALVDLLAGQIDIVADQVSSSMPHLKAGTLQAFAILSPSRDGSFPEVPTLKELGLGAFDMTTYAGILAPAGLSAAISNKLTDAIRRAVNDPAFKSKLKELGGSAVFGTPEQFATVIKSEGQLASRLIAEGRLKSE